ncbi:hypothetical protein Pla100_36800 [Neorhodopirellula pilleata]|uniref:Uncharacterized protein n=1 Tax=Neorhodopirellula pilleata TaxID=2714738 RepID=A0A5C6A6F5_9BACT|nr:hypothetical protein Pla100_36800 [Neorhodopirellula pilleata]
MSEMRAWTLGLIFVVMRIYNADVNLSQERQNHDMHVRTGNSSKTSGWDSRLGNC